MFAVHIMLLLTVCSKRNLNRMRANSQVVYLPCVPSHQESCELTPINVELVLAGQGMAVTMPMQSSWHGSLAASRNETRLVAKARSMRPLCRDSYKQIQPQTDLDTSN